MVLIIEHASEEFYFFFMLFGRRNIFSSMEAKTSVVKCLRRCRVVPARKSNAIRKIDSSNVYCSSLNTFNAIEPEKRKVQFLFAESSELSSSKYHERN